jgi:hypothetical protein
VFGAFQSAEANEGLRYAPFLRQNELTGLSETIWLHAITGLSTSVSCRIALADQQPVPSTISVFIVFRQSRVGLRQSHCSECRKPEIFRRATFSRSTTSGVRDGIAPQDFACHE